MPPRQSSDAALLAFRGRLLRGVGRMLTDTSIRSTTRVIKSLTTTTVYQSGAGVVVRTTSASP